MSKTYTFHMLKNVCRCCFVLHLFFLNEEMEESHGTEWQKSKVSGTDPTWFEWPGSRQPSVPELLVIYKGFDLCLQLDHSPCARMTWILTTCLCFTTMSKSMSSFKDKSVCVLMSEQTGCLSTGHPVPTSSTSSDFHSWEDDFSSAFHSEWLDEQASFTGFTVLGCCSVHEHIWFFPGLSDGVETSTSGVLSLHRETKFIIDLDFAVVLSSPESCCVLFDITSEHSTKLKWLMSIKKPFIACEIPFSQCIWFGFLVLIIRSNNFSRANLCVLETCLNVGFLPFF